MNEEKSDYDYDKRKTSILFLFFSGMYFASAMTLVALSCFMTVIVLNFHYRGNNGRKVPRWVRMLVINKIGVLVCSTKNTRRFYKSHTHTGHAVTKVAPENEFEVRQITK